MAQSQIRGQCSGAAWRTRGRCCAVARLAPSALRRRCVAAHYSKRWPDPQFVAETKLQYEGLGMYAKPLADPEEARVLLSIGYVLLDVRPAVDVDRLGKVTGSVQVPYLIATKKFDPEQSKTIVTTSPNKDFLKEVQRRFPDRENALLLVADLNGRSGGQEALAALESAGYLNLVGAVGGFNAFWRVFDAKLARRPSRGAFLEDPWSGGSSQGIFAGES